jgi:hypothetical protein
MRAFVILGGKEGKVSFRRPLGTGTGLASLTASLGRPATVDTMCGDAAAAALRAACVSGRWEDVLNSLRPGGDPHHHVFLVDQFGMLGREWGEARPEALDAIVADRSNDPAALLMRGAYDIRWGWSARGAGRSGTVSRDSFALFHERLRRAERDLLLAARIDQRDPAPWVQLLASGRGLQIEKPELRARFNEAQRRAPGLWTAHTQMLQGLCAKWSGSHEIMFAFARDSSAAAERGSPLHVLVALAHYERYLDFDTQPDREGYASQPAVRDEIDRSGRLALATGRLAATPDGRTARDALAYVAGLFGVDQLALELYEATGDVITPGIWWGVDGWAGWYTQTRRNVTARAGTRPTRKN